MTFYERIQRIQIKRRLKAAFRRVPKPARVIPREECCNGMCNQGRECPLRVTK